MRRPVRQRGHATVLLLALAGCGSAMEQGAPAVPSPITPVPSGPSVAFRHRAQWAAISGGTVDLSLVWDPSACAPASLASCGVPANGSGSVAFGGLSSTVTLAGTAAARLGATPTAQATTNFGSAQVGVAGCAGAPLCTGVTAISSVLGLTSAQTYATIRYTIAAGAGGAVTTTSKVLEVSTPFGDVFSLVLSGAGQNLVLQEGTLTLP